MQMNLQQANELLKTAYITADGRKLTLYEALREDAITDEQLKARVVQAFAIRVKEHWN